jgi:ribosomal protein S18 acetylase RimI-like enzyme
VSHQTGGLKIAPIQNAEVPSVIALWERCGLTRPWNDPQADIVLARRGANSTVIVGYDADALVAALMVGHDGHRGWIYYVAVDPAAQGRGFGRLMMAAAENWLRERGLAKAELLIRPDNEKVEGFYKALGYHVQPRVVLARWLDGRPPTS